MLVVHPDIYLDWFYLGSLLKLALNGGLSNNVIALRHLTAAIMWIMKTVRF